MEVFRSSQQVIQKLLLDFRTEKDGRPVVGLLQGEGRLNGGCEKKVLVRYLSESEWKQQRPGLVRRWIAASRPAYFIFTLAPQMVGLILAYPYIDKIGATMSFLFLFFLQLGCTYYSDVEDHLRGVDLPAQSGGSGVIRNLWIPAINLRRASWLMLTLSLLIGMLFLLYAWREEILSQLLPVALFGLVLAINFSGWPFRLKYFALGETTIGLLTGPILIYAHSIAVSYAAVSDTLVLLASLPVGLMLAMRLFLNHIQRIPFDRKAGTTTLATLLGFYRAKQFFATLCASLFFLVIGISIYLQIIPAMAIMLPAGVWVATICRGLMLTTGPLDVKLPALRVQFANMQWFFFACYGAFLFIHLI